MIDIKIRFLIFQSGKVDEEVEIQQSFIDPTQLSHALVNFSAQECAMRLEPQVRPIWNAKGPRINMPPVKKGLGPATNLVIKEIIIP